MSTDPEAAVLATIRAARGRVTVDRIVSSTGLSAAAVDHAVSALVAAGHIEARWTSRGRALVPKHTTGGQP